MALFNFTPPLDTGILDKGFMTRPWMGFFSSVSVDKQQWKPAISGLTGTPVVSASFTRFGPIVRLWCGFTGNSTSSGTTLTFPFKCSGSGSVQFWNAATKTFIGYGYMKDSTLYFPAWSGLLSVEFFGDYQLEAA